MKSVNGLLSSHDLQSLVLNKKRQFCDEMGCEGGFEKTPKKNHRTVEFQTDHKAEEARAALSFIILCCCVDGGENSSHSVPAV